MGLFGFRKNVETHRLLDTPRGPRPAGYPPGTPVPGEIAVYFADDPRKLYQLHQWLPVFELLHERHPVVIITRNPRSYDALLTATKLRVVLAPAFPDLVDLYECSDFKVAVYVNNSVHNFHSLMQRHMLHIHVNHGESDKVCMVSNQVKAYDRVFVAGEAAVRRHRAALIEFNESSLVRVGRPQLDLRPDPLLPPSPRRTILYAPTWEGENASNNYTSIDVLGPAIVAAALAVPDVRLVYKPHPRAAISPLPSMAAAHREIVRLVEAAARRDPDAGHRVHTTGDILAVFPGCDLMITDVSSVGLDFLYLRAEAPMFIADRYDDRARLHAAAPISRCADVIDSTTVGALTATLAERLEVDRHRAARSATRTHYFGELVPGESTARFVAAIGDAVAVRDRQLGITALEEAAMGQPLNVVILAAGMGTRLGMPHPKPLTPLADGRSILRQQLDNLRAVFGDRARVTIVVGFHAEEVMAAAPDALFAYNERYAQTNTSKSLLTALRSSAPGGVLWLNGDVVFDPRLLDSIAPAILEDRSFVCVNTEAVGEEEVKYTASVDGFVVELSKSVVDGLGEAVGINYIASSDKATLVEHLEACTDTDYFERGIELAIGAAGMRVVALDISEFFVVEVDFAADLERANVEVGKTVTPAA